jgi:hypothetical protein
MSLRHWRVRDHRRPFRRVLLFAGAIVSLAAPSPALAETCPTPIVFIPAHGTDTWLVTLALNAVSEANADGVRFVGFLHPAIAERRSSGDEYLLSAQPSAPDADLHGVTLTLTDPKGRPVATATASADPADRDPSDLDHELAAVVAAALTPMRELIRAHQRSVRSSEPNVAIHARVHADPAALGLAVDETATLRFELHDCDGAALGERTVQVDVRGVGDVEPREVTSDAAGAGAISYVSRSSGDATIYLVYPYDRPEGVGAVADGDTLVPVTVGGDVAVEHTGASAGVVAFGRSHSCGGPGGAWSGSSSLTFDLPEVRGTLHGQGDFTFPADPEPGARAAAAWTMTGTLVLPDVGGEVAFTGSWSFEAVLHERDGTWLLGSEGGTVAGSVVATIPGAGRFSIPMGWAIEHGPPAPLVFVERLPECGP